MSITDCALRIKFPYTVFSDGAAKGRNGEGQASSGFVVYDREGKLYTFATGIGVQTNNFAEYQGLIMALKWVCNNVDKDERCVHFKTDSQVMQKHITGEYQVKHENLLGLHAQVMNLLGRLDGWKVEWVRREFNKEADAACNAAIKHGRYEWKRNEQHAP